MEKRHGKTVLMNMNKTIKENLLPKLRERYARRLREGKTRMLDELWRTTATSASMPSNSWAMRCPRPAGGRIPARQYERIEPVVRVIWLAAEQPCGNRIDSD